MSRWLPSASSTRLSGHPWLTSHSRRCATRPAAARALALRYFMTPFVLGMALAESVSIMGFLLGYMNLTLPLVVPFFVAAVALQVGRFPTLESVEQPFEKLHGACFRDDG